MSTREGTIIKLEDLLNEAIERVSKIIEEKNPNLEEKRCGKKGRHWVQLYLMIYTTVELKMRYLIGIQCLILMEKRDLIYNTHMLELIVFYQKLAIFHNFQSIDINILNDDASINLQKHYIHLEML